MKRRSLTSILACLVTATSVAPALAAETGSEEIDRTVWSVVSRTVIEYDIEGMAAVYHPDAVLVSGRGTAPIAEALASWGEGMEEQKRTGASATVAFRFEIRQDGEQTAFETGMFNYTTLDSEGNASPAFVPFEALLVKKDGRWLILMERQLTPADQAAWDALAQD